jgi:hypothetical protein
MRKLTDQDGGDEQSEWPSTKGLRIEFLDQRTHVVIMPLSAGGVCGVRRVQPNRNSDYEHVPLNILTIFAFPSAFNDGFDDQQISDSQSD